MLKFIVLAISAFSVSAFACPNLQGSWTCKSDFNNSVLAPMTVTQQGSGNQTTYTFENPHDTQTLITDGQDHTQTEPHTGASVTNNAVCASDSVLTAKVHLNSSNPPIVLDGKMSWNSPNASTMLLSADLTATINGQVQHSVQTATCTKN